MTAPRQGVRYFDQNGMATDAGYQMLAALRSAAPEYLTIEPRTSDPAAPVTGQIWLRTDM
jgi:hypothetical protein